MTYVFDFDQPPETTEDESLRLLGGKGHNLGVMTNELGLPVPPGFTITTEAGLAYLEEGWPAELDEEIETHMRRLEEKVGRSFGGPGEPLLVSVRSGAAVSMPGMMDTVLNLGLNDDSTRQLGEACGDDAFAEESRQRLNDMYREIVGSEAPEDPWAQLKGAIEAVFRSWNTPRAKSYREHDGIPHDLGSAVTVQTMVFGNLDDDSATGVVFTRNPATGERELYGDVMFRAQGEDVVAGKASPESIDSLDERLPDVARELRDYADVLERHYRDVCDIEFTIERGKLWMLQVRIGKRSPQAALRIAVEMAEDDEFPLSRSEACVRVASHLADPPSAVTRIAPDVDLLTRGLAASPGLVSGRVATGSNTAIQLADEGDRVILVRPETSPDDVQGMARSVGILTSTGGLASHAAVVARGWGIPAVVGANEVTVEPGKITVGGYTLEDGAVITIDGRTGEVFSGEIEVETTVTPDASKLLDWAEELDIEIPSAVLAGDPGSGEEVSSVEAPEEETVIRALRIKGFATPEDLAPVLLSTPEAVAPVLDAIEGKGLTKKIAEMFQLNDEGTALGDSLIAGDRERWSIEKANSALDGFLPLDGRMKEIVTSWQMREVDGEQVINDHSDEQYDEAVLSEFSSLHHDAIEWLEPLTTELGRLQLYHHRLARAALRVAEGEHAYIASPRIDSYHNIWFELHEDLILLAGRTREEETEAGRA
jgi:pyruvate,orthophosphate dikinase